MKKIKGQFLLLLFILIQIIVNFLPLYSQTISESDRLSILKVLKYQEIKWNEGNLEGYMEGYLRSDSLKFITKKGVTYGWENTLQKYQKSYPDKASMGNLNFEVINIEALCENKAMMTGKWTLSYTGSNTLKNEVGGYFTLIWQKIDGKWLIVVDHTS